MDHKDAVALIELCSNAANPWPKTDTRYWIFELGYTRGLLASILAEDPILRNKVIKHSQKIQEENRAQKIKNHDLSNK